MHLLNIICILIVSICSIEWLLALLFNNIFMKTFLRNVFYQKVEANEGQEKGIKYRLEH